MKIVADENIAHIAEAFGNLGELVTMPGRSITAELLKDADALLVRSVTNVDESLLQGSPCRFVGTATSGVDHIDTAWLANNNIRLSWARGCNAVAVVDYVLTALAALTKNNIISGWTKKSIGIIGCGEIGRRLAQRALVLGMQVKISDPLLNATHSLAAYFCSLEEVLQQDIISIHTPLTKAGPFATYHLLDAQNLASLKPGAVLINAARGAVIDNQALSDLLAASATLVTVLDAWEGEPKVNLKLLQQVDLGTVHIAGYSLNGKRNGTELVLRDFCNFFNIAEPCLPPADKRTITPELSVVNNHEDVLNQLILATYDIESDHKFMQALLKAKDPAAYFDNLRKTYAVRHELGDICLRLPPLPASMEALLVAAGFQLNSGDNETGTVPAG